ncbi:peptidase C65 Otubain-domain-containing protein [Polychytrium aggregatum]|uniref:peptidase C65 Otubain-domain-containing protein n=1 Tax=Polychytrium aggregatum TaxID=110093 RepID=UPI0022FEF3A7|nr:peptidase C65 Otubain-domain-containing protein [Polychytrium aggregatum]KAI9207571.1 peptidase C65 Otubain-domain-containing protein [Polychytrium aggregatum]
MDPASQPDRPTDEEILRFERSIKEQETGNQPLVSELLGFEGLRAEYQSGLEAFRSKVEQLAESHMGLRTIKKDGNCFYRAFAFRFCELVWKNAGTDWASVMLNRAIASQALMAEMGYDMNLLEEFWDCFAEALKPHGKTPEDLLTIFQTDYLSDTIVCYLRLVTAAVLKKHAEMYEGFVLDSYPSLTAFISAQVEPMNVESDQIHIVCMANVFGVDVKIANLDPTEGSDGAVLNFHEITPMDAVGIDEKDRPKVVLLYRPGHYDVLYPRA